MPFWADWRAERALRARAAAFVARLAQDPPTEDVAWLAANAAAGDADHARWELRYARHALGLLTAQRDALDDRTASSVAAALADALARDPNVAPGKLGVAEKQLNARLTAYGEALGGRAGGGTGWQLGSALLRFAGAREDQPPEVVAHAGELLARYLSEANEALRQQFGSAALPEDVPPSAARTGRA